MHKEIQQVIDTISTVSGLDIEVVDNNLVRIAGTGIYSGNVGKSIISAGNLLNYTLSSGKPLLINNPRENSICHDCKKKHDCKELLSMCAPISDNSKVYGAIEFVCFDQKSKQHILQKSEIYTHFLLYVARTIAERCKEKQDLANLTELLDVMSQVVNTTGKGVLIFNAKGDLAYHNDRSQEILHSKNISQLENKHIKSTGLEFGNFEGFSIKFVNNNQQVMGKYMSLSSELGQFKSIFVFDTIQAVLSPSLTASSLALDSSLNQIIGNSSEIMCLKEQIISTAGTSSTVLISGESGTGKELVARAIHASGERVTAPFIAINCGAIPDTLLESEFFGYVGGAFTGASRKGQVGKFEMAEGGVLFLDEVSSMPLYLQVKLLRVLQERSFTRLGSNQVIEVDIRVIAASNEDLLELVEQNKFRGDLYYRLNVVPINVPPLREHLEDLDLLISFFIDKFCSRYNKTKLQLSKNLINRMKSYNWPGNVRELEHCIEYLVNISNQKGLINMPSLPDGFLKNSQESEINGKLLTLQEVENRAILQALKHFGNTTEGKRLASKSLGISLATLYRKLEQDKSYFSK